MKYLPSIVIASVLAANAPALADGRPAYAVLRIGTTPEQLLVARFPSLLACQRELDRLMALVAEDLRRPRARQFDVILPGAVLGHDLAAPPLDGMCKMLPHLHDYERSRDRSRR